MANFGAVDDGDQQPDHGDDLVYSDDVDFFLHQQPGQGRRDDDEDFISDSDDDYRSAQGDSDDDDDFMSDSDDVDDLDEEDPDEGYEDEGEEESSSFPVNAPPAEAAAAAIAALEWAEAPADGDCCPVCLNDDGGGRRPWRRVAPCGHRFHAACVEKWLRVKLSCPVCRRCPAAAAEHQRRRRPVPDIVEEMLAMGYEETLVFEKSPRWVEFMADDPRNSSAGVGVPLAGAG